MLSASTPSRTAFISGPLAPTSAYFQEHYVPKLDAAIAQGHAFVLGPARGVAALALEYLRQHRAPPSRVAVFLSEADAAQPQLRAFADGLRAKGVKVVVAGAGYAERDAAMTAASDYDILRYHTEAECRALYGKKYRPRVSGTELNEIRRRDAQAPVAATKPAVPAPTRTAFISGPLAPSPTYFSEHYVPKIDLAITQGHAFVVGPSKGIDTLALEHLRQQRVPPSRVTVFLSKSEDKQAVWRQFAAALRAQGLKWWLARGTRSATRR
ncbi:hypothetical protein FB451DRAFT_1225326 [Mycena latifolia]|nr:hypothetical protein FB451DRAFT_1225326 [Mycena latifolia]